MDIGLETPSIQHRRLDNYVESGMERLSLVIKKVERLQACVSIAWGAYAQWPSLCGASNTGSHLAEREIGIEASNLRFYF